MGMLSGTGAFLFFAFTSTALIAFTVKEPLLMVAVGSDTAGPPVFLSLPPGVGAQWRCERWWVNAVAVSLMLAIFPAPVSLEL